MNVGIFCTDTGKPMPYVLGAACVRSIRATMPGVMVAHLTDSDSRELEGVDLVLRQPRAPFALARVQHQRTVRGEWLFLDTDVWVQADVREVFADARFDVAVADRAWPHHPHLSAAFLGAMPYNVGIVFSRSPAFWVAVEHAIHARGGDLNAWMGDQLAACEVIRSGAFRVKVLPGLRYHYPPNSVDDGAVMRAAALIHYKGERKGFMLERIRRGRAVCGGLSDGRP